MPSVPGSTERAADPVLQVKDTGHRHDDKHQQIHQSGTYRRPPPPCDASRET
ncbi:hypothetical protein ACFVWX_06915 [Streptomyces sp. NPDC058220]|uniref:hypothetical protein n=1 Tax=unclassified Streptomyces TaxID=2593676 RepID=UPI0036E59C84